MLALSFDAITGIWLALIGFVLGQSARGYAVQTEFSSRIEGISVADVMDADPVAIPENASVELAIDEYFLRYRWPWFPVVDAADHFRGLLVREVADGVPELQPRQPDGRRRLRARRQRQPAGARRRPARDRCSETTPCAASAASRRSTPRAVCAA